METQRNYGNPENMCRLARAQKYSREHDVPLAVPILGYLMLNELTCVPVIRSTRKASLPESLMAAEMPVSPEDARLLAKG